jgi:hypothetical protein
MTPIQYFYKLGERQALQDASRDAAFKSFLNMYPPQMRGYVSSIFDSNDHSVVSDRAKWFAENFLKQSGGLDKKLLRMALREGVGATASTIGEGAQALSGTRDR